MTKENIVIYQGENGEICVDARLENDTIWLTQKAMAEVFGCTSDNISLHLKKIFESGELEKNSVTEEYSATASDGKKYRMQFYNLDAIISVGYRVKSKTATHFRQWATKILRNYMIEGYAINEKRLREQEKKLELLKSTLSLIERGIDNKLEVQHLKNFLKDFSAGFNMLDAYDHERLDTKGRSKSDTAIIEPKEFLEMIQSMRTAFDSDVFGRPKDESFESSVRQIYQSFGGVDCYETLEEKAAMLLYLIVKNHSFVDGNKRIAVASFLYFLNKNHLLYKSDGKPVIDDNTLFALTILVAESDKSEMETTKNMIITILNARN